MFWNRKTEADRMAEAAASPSAAQEAKAKEALAEGAAMTEAEVAEAAERVERDFLGKLVRVLARLNRDVALRLLTGFFAMKDPAVPLAAKGGFAAILLYFINPLDLIPDLTPVVGYLDDAGVIAAAWMYLAGHVTEAHRARAEAYLDGASPETA